MYLTDRDIRARLAEFQFDADDISDPFDPSEQIGPCSVDLRLSRVYWRPRARRSWRLGRPLAIDLSRGQIMELNPSRGWRRIEAQPHDVISVQPGQLLLGRTAEKFSVPSDCAAALEGRSSFARLGLSVHASGGFINPGYVGRMPLTLFNASPFTIRIPVGTPLCQVMFIKLEGNPDADYQQRSDRKYRDDYGGPSYWWRDAAMRRIHARVAAARLGEKVFDELEQLFWDEEPEFAVYERLETFLSRAGTMTYGSADELMTAFSKSEDTKQILAKTALYPARGALPVALGVVVPYLAYQEDRDTMTVVISVIVMVLTLVATAWGIYQKLPQYMTRDNLRALQQRASANAAARSSGNKAADG